MDFEVCRVTPEFGMIRLTPQERHLIDDALFNAMFDEFTPGCKPHLSKYIAPLVKCFLNPDNSTVLNFRNLRSAHLDTLGALVEENNLAMPYQLAGTVGGLVAQLSVAARILEQTGDGYTPPEVITAIDRITSQLPVPDSPEELQ